VKSFLEIDSGQTPASIARACAEGEHAIIYGAFESGVFVHPKNSAASEETISWMEDWKNTLKKKFNCRKRINHPSGRRRNGGLTKAF
jgi:hypothetical protein